jgi:phage repressor protein C with HTH and peptisase S24 domain
MVRNRPDFLLVVRRAVKAGLLWRDRIRRPTVSAASRHIKAASFYADRCCESCANKAIIPSFRHTSPPGRIPGQWTETPMMLSHAQIWNALDRLAERNGLSPSGLAKKAGLDATTFNKSKRITNDGRERWPSTESVSKALTATGVTIDSFVTLIEGTKRIVQSVPLLGFAQAGNGGYFDDAGFPTGSKGWDEVGLPSISDEHAYALQISGDSMKPVFRDGDIIVVSPASPIRKGDRVVVKTKDGEVLAKELKRRTAKTIELQSLNPNHVDRSFAATELEWIARIVWASQ